MSKERRSKHQKMSRREAAAETPRRRRGPAFLAICALIPVAAGGAVGLGFSLRSPQAAPGPSAAPAVTGALPTGLNLAGSAQPKPWQYDAVNNRHWHAVSGGHWDPGPPPPEAFSDTPEPWEYDPVKNQHWHPGHRHWHPGPPPDEASRAAALSTPPTQLPPVNLAPGAPAPIALPPAAPPPGHN